ncbi:hypothetical protein AB0B10_25190 [Micromonospora arborensis]|uniref:hypothetical protein n=1 Tax=Micromonospora arborensis TaxID=2116518 RepID=UPI003401AFBE
MSALNERAPHGAVARVVVTGDVLPADEHWQTGDIVLDANRALYCRAHDEDIAQGWPWAYAHGHAPRREGGYVPEGGIEETGPVRPLTLLLRDGQPVVVAATDSVPPAVVALDSTPASQQVETADQNDRLRAALREQAREWNRGIPPYLTLEVATTVFERMLAAYPGATPEVIAVALIRLAEQWDEVAAVDAALRRFGPPTQPSADPDASTGDMPATRPGQERGGDDGRQ